ncbi:hypothetical protein T11_16740 [Trichinella zimbabwensis]|uniref:Uncharacterized protein n=1 Tax=Trichinella zimbabwensis TaxID=268475 RepID=A0A0V1I989_9BILA|nr:hypothetical protein T11_16740 [Trichinella zimbabwensis]
MGIVMLRIYIRRGIAHTVSFSMGVPQVPLYNNLLSLIMLSGTCSRISILLSFSLCPGVCEASYMMLPSR